MSDTPRTQELREDLAGISSEAQIWKLFKKLEDMERELNAVTEQRDELLRYNEAFRKDTLICVDCDAISKEEYDQAIEQRDRLTRQMQDACELIADIMRDEVNIVDECEKFLRAYAPELLFPTNQPNKQ